jgi:hypothetical protein
MATYVANFSDHGNAWMRSYRHGKNYATLVGHADPCLACIPNSQKSSRERSTSLLNHES